MSAFKGCVEEKILEMVVEKVKAANASLDAEDIKLAANSFFAKMVAADSYKPAFKVGAKPFIADKRWGGYGENNIVAKSRTDR